ncbi:cupin domain-containing protein [Caballeronia sp. EK]|uniref:cupin domain-containing protein n=1 Tax=Caballeronia sp. EK TaxID=2767469 RepID=UPI001655C56B|nr:cupin domain-containing protein [Caballeronia sp. EK]MBC8642768.1 cupin domain-containing protein [Caballeronia sp. EK]
MTRRVVTGRDGSGASTFASDGPAPWCASFASVPGFEVSMLWATGGTVAPSIEHLEESGKWPESWVPAADESRVLLVTFPPDAVFASDGFDGMAAHREQMEKLPGLAEAFEADNPGMHTTQTLDYGVVLSGEIHLELDNGQMRKLKPKDFVVQRATRHAWRNLSAEPATVLFVLLGSK